MKQKLKELKASTFPATRATYKKLAFACTTAIIAEETFVKIVFPKWMTLCDDFPRPLKKKQQGDILNVGHFSAKQVLNWCYKHKYSAFNTKQLKRMILDSERTFQAFTIHQEKLFNRVDNWIDECVIEEKVDKEE